MDEKRYKEIKSRDMEWHLQKKTLTEWKNYPVIQVNLKSCSGDDEEQRFSQTCFQVKKSRCAFSLWEHTEGLILPVQPWCPHLCWLMTHLWLKNQGSVLPPASANPAQVLVMCFESGRSRWRATRVWLCPDTAAFGWWALWPPPGEVLQARLGGLQELGPPPITSCQPLVSHSPPKL